MRTRNLRQIAVAAVAAATCAVGVINAPVRDGSTAAAEDVAVTYVQALPLVAPDTEELVVLRTGRGGMCSATPIRGTSSVVTAAHCLVDRSIRHHPVGGSFALRNQAVYFEVEGVAVDNPVTWFTVHPAYFGEHHGSYDVAVVYTRHAWPFGATRVGFGDRAVTDLAAYGMQRIGEDGYRLDRDALLDRSNRGLDPAPRAPARCSLPLDLFRTDARTVTAECGLVSGASGGPVLARTDDGDTQLVGVVSSVTGDHRSNWFVTSVVVEELLENVGVFVETGEVPQRIDLAPWELFRKRMVS